MHNGGVTVSFERRTVIHAPVGVVFDLSIDVDVHLQSQARSGERAIAEVTTGTIGPFHRGTRRVSQATGREAASGVKGVASDESH